MRYCQVSLALTATWHLSFGAAHRPEGGRVCRWLPGALPAPRPACRQALPAPRPAPRHLCRTVAIEALTAPRPAPRHLCRTVAIEATPEIRRQAANCSPWMLQRHWPQDRVFACFVENTVFILCLASPNAMLRGTALEPVAERTYTEKPHGPLA